MAIVRYIDLPAHFRRGVREKFGVTEEAVNFALNFRRNDGVSKETQEYALGLPGATLMYRASAKKCCTRVIRRNHTQARKRGS